VIVDSAALRRGERESLHRMAQELELPSFLLSCEAPEAVLRERIRERAQRSNEVSEATESILDHQLATAEPIAPSESAYTVHVHTDQPDGFERLLQALEPRIKHTRGPFSA